MLELEPRYAAAVIVRRTMASCEIIENGKIETTYTISEEEFYKSMPRTRSHLELAGAAKAWKTKSNSFNEFSTLDKF